MECDDVRLQPIELRSRFTCAKALLVSDKGRPLGWQKLEIEGPEWKNELTADRDGWVYFTTTQGGPALTAIGPKGETSALVDGASIVARKE